MAMPWAPQSGVSVGNLLPHSPLEEMLSSVAVSAPTPARNPAPPQTSGRIAPHDAPQAGSTSWHGETAIVVGLSTIWLAGVCLLTGVIVAERLRLRRAVRRGRPVTDGPVVSLLEECKRMIGTNADVRVVAIDGLASPALFGFVRPRLLLPHDPLDLLDKGELRHIFLHELAHLKRCDIFVAHIVSVLHVLHWFNPVIALGLRRMRTDVELACDTMAMSRLNPGEASAYGRTVLHQVERAIASPQYSVLPGLCGDRNQIKRRIATICAFRKETRRWSPLAVLLVTCLVCVGLTNGRVGPLPEPPACAWDAYARRPFRTAYQNRHANILRCCLRNVATGKYLTAEGQTVLCGADEPGEAGLWEFRFDESTNTANDVMYFYSVAAHGYLTSDAQGHLGISQGEPDGTTQWGVVPLPAGVWVVSHHYGNGYLRLDERGQVAAENFGRDERGYWDVHSVWRVKTSDDPKSNPQWQREHIPGLD